MMQLISLTNRQPTLILPPITLLARELLAQTREIFQLEAALKNENKTKIVVIYSMSRSGIGIVLPSGLFDPLRPTLTVGTVRLYMSLGTEGSSFATDLSPFNHIN